MSQSNNKDDKRSILPLIGFVLIVALGVIAAFLAEPLTTFLGRTLTNFPPPGVPINTVRIIVGVITFAILGLVASFLVAAAIPKKKSQVKEVDLVKSRQRMVAEKQLNRKRQQQINKSNRDVRK